MYYHDSSKKIGIVQRNLQCEGVFVCLFVSGSRIAVHGMLVFKWLTCTSEPECVLDCRRRIFFPNVSCDY